MCLVCLYNITKPQNIHFKKSNILTYRVAIRIKWNISYKALRTVLCTQCTLNKCYVFLSQQSCSFLYLRCIQVSLPCQVLCLLLREKKTESSISILLFLWYNTLVNTVNKYTNPAVPFFKNSVCIRCWTWLIQCDGIIDIF